VLIFPAWLAGVFDETIRLPNRAGMLAAVERRERRTRRRLDDSPAGSIIGDRHAYVGTRPGGVAPAPR
jgi:hypothetical protein